MIFRWNEEKGCLEEIKKEDLTIRDMRYDDLRFKQHLEQTKKDLATPRTGAIWKKDTGDW